MLITSVSETLAQLVEPCEKIRKICAICGHLDKFTGLIFLEFTFYIRAQAQFLIGLRLRRLELAQFGELQRTIIVS